MSAYLFQIARDKSFDYLLIIYKWQFPSRFSILHDKWRGRLLQLYWVKIWHVNSSVKFIHSLQVMYENWTVSLLLVKSSLYSRLNSRRWTESERKLPHDFDAAFFKTVFWVVKKLCRVQVYLRKETLQPAQNAQTKMPRNEAIIYQETDFLSTEEHLLTSSGCFLT